MIIGHRGARGLAPENTLLAIKKGIAAGADAVELDVRLTKDKALVLFHDKTLARIAGKTSKISSLELEKIQGIRTYGNESIPTLEQALAIAGKTPLFIEGKGANWAGPLVDVLQKYKGPQPAVISKNHEELAKFSRKRPDIETYAVSSTNPFGPLWSAKKYGFTGVDLNFRLFSPLVYFIARRANLKIIIYTINSPSLLSLIRLLYPKIHAITTDFPDRFSAGSTKHAKI